MTEPGLQAYSYHTDRLVLSVFSFVPVFSVKTILDKKILMM